MSRDVGNVFGLLETSFDFQRADASIYEVRDESVGRQILRAEQVFHIAEVNVFSVADQVVGKPARLSTLAAVRAATAERFAGQALT